VFEGGLLFFIPIIGRALSMNAKKQNYAIKLSIGIAVGWILIFLLTGCDGKA
jgi:hypothetical protein